MQELRLETLNEIHKKGTNNIISFSFAERKQLSCSLNFYDEILWKRNEENCHLKDVQPLSQSFSKTLSPLSALAVWRYFCYLLHIIQTILPRHPVAIQFHTQFFSIVMWIFSFLFAFFVGGKKGFFWMKNEFLVPWSDIWRCLEWDAEVFRILFSPFIG